MAANELPQQYTSVYAFFRAHGITLKNSEGWRLTPRLVGEVNGIPTSRGILTATNGILCYIEQEIDGRVTTFEGHIAWFVPDDATADPLAATPAPKGPSKRELARIASLELYL